MKSDKSEAATQWFGRTKPKPTPVPPSSDVDRDPTFPKSPAWRLTHHLTIRVPLPLDLPPQLVIDALHACTPLLEHHPILAGFEERVMTDADADAVLRDPFFEIPGRGGDLSSPAPFRAFDVREREEGQSAIPCFGSYRQHPGPRPAVGQCVARGLRFRIHAAGGVVSRGEFLVVRRGAAADPVVGEHELQEKGLRTERKKKKSPFTKPPLLSPPSEETEWDIVCRCAVEMSAKYLPIQWWINRSNRQLCQELCEGVLEQAAENRRWL